MTKRFSTGVTAGLTAAVSSFGLGLLQGAAQRVTGAIGDAIDAASALNETESKSRVIFGDAAGAMDTFGQSAATNIGLSKQAAIEAGATFGNLFTNLGQSQANAEKMSERLVTLAGDLASFNDIDPTVALEKLRSGLSGESEPLRQVGVFLTEAKVKAKAMQLGLVDAHGELSEGAKVMARYQLILEETTTAQGDFARTSDGLANSQRIANAEMENAKAKFGAALIPAATLFDKIATQGIRGLSDFADKTREAGEATGDFVRRGIEGWQSFFNETGTVVVPATAAVENLSASLDESGSQARNTAHEFDRLRTGSITPLTSGIPPLSSTIETLATMMDRARSSANTLADDLETNLYGSTVNLGRKQELTDQISDLETKLKHTKDRGDATIIRGQIAGLRKELMDLDLQIAIAKGPQALLDQLHAWEKQFKLTNHQAYLAILALEKLYRDAGMLPDVTVTVTGISGTHAGEHRATGGPVLPYHTYAIGEAGPETLVMGSSGGTIYPTLAGVVSPDRAAAASFSPISMGGAAIGSRGGDTINNNVQLVIPANPPPNGLEALERASFYLRSGIIPQRLTPSRG
jgi:hypothetical protein